MLKVALHYKLAMEDKDANDPHGQIVYTPLLDAQRDEKILNVLPDYLTDEIMFAREQGISAFVNETDGQRVCFTGDLINIYRRKWSRCQVFAGAKLPVRGVFLESFIAELIETCGQ